MSEDDALDETITARWDDAIHEMKLHGVEAWKQNNSICVEDEESNLVIAVPIEDQMVKTAPIMKFLGY